MRAERTDDTSRGQRRIAGEPEAIVLEAGACRAVVEPALGGRLVSFTVDGWELLVANATDPYRWGNFAMAPFVGRLRHGQLRHAGRTYDLPVNVPPHALFGLVTLQPWRRVGEASVEADIGTPWPWTGRVRQSFELEPGRLVSRLSLEADAAMPASLGWHPWFARYATKDGRPTLGPVALDVAPRLMYENDGEEIPTGVLGPPAARPWDYCFRDLPTPPRLRWPGLGTLTITSDCRDWVIYERDPTGICVEPWTAPPNALNGATPRIVTPDSPLGATMTWLWSPDGPVRTAPR